MAKKSGGVLSNLIGRRAKLTMGIVSDEKIAEYKRHMTAGAKDLSSNHPLNRLGEVGDVVAVTNGPEGLCVGLVMDDGSTVETLFQFIAVMKEV